MDKLIALVMKMAQLIEALTDHDLSNRRRIAKLEEKVYGKKES